MFDFGEVWKKKLENALAAKPDHDRRKQERRRARKLDGDGTNGADGPDVAVDEDGTTSKIAPSMKKVVFMGRNVAMFKRATTDGDGATGK